MNVFIHPQAASSAPMFLGIHLCSFDIATPGRAVLAAHVDAHLVSGRQEALEKLVNRFRGH